MEGIEQLLNFQDLTGTFSVTDVVLGLLLSFVLTAFIVTVSRLGKGVIRFVREKGRIDAAQDATARSEARRVPNARRMSL